MKSTLQNTNSAKKVVMSEKTTMRVGGEALFYKEVASKDALKDAINEAQENNVPLFVIGEGSNITLGDTTLKMYVVRMKNTDWDVETRGEEYKVTVGAGMNWDEFVSKTVENGLQGVECLSGIPGTVGAAPVQNIGAYGQELKDSFYSLTAYDTKNNMFVSFSKEECGFGYRDSIFKSSKEKGRYVIYDVTFILHKNKKPTVKYKALIDYVGENGISNPSLIQIRDAVLAIRNSKLENPAVMPNAGSFFKNPIVKKETIKKLLMKYPSMPHFPYDETFDKLSAGWLIDTVGWKGKMYKNVGVSEKHALVLVNPDGKGTAQEIVELAELIKKDVSRTFGIELEREVEHIS